MHGIKLEPLRHVDRHERHLALRVIHLLVCIGKERNILKEGIESRPRMFFVEFADGVHHFVQVADAFIGGNFIFLAQEFLIAHVVNDAFRKNGKRSFARGNKRLPVKNQVRKSLELGGGTAHTIRFGEQVFPEGSFAVAFALQDVFDGRLADGSRRRVDYAQVGGIVLFVSQEAQVREDILDFLAVPESHAAKNHRRNAAVIQRLFQGAGLRIRAVEDRRLRIKIGTSLRNRIGNSRSFATVIHKVAHMNKFARIFLGEHILLHFLRTDVVRNHGTCALHDVCRGAVVAFKLYNRHRGKVTVEVADNLDVRAAPAINTLVVVAHHRHIFLFIYQ